MIYQLGPRALRVFAAVRARIAGGDWAPGTKLPSHRDLAAEFGVAPMTMRQVLAQLEEQGLVSRQLGRGTFVRAASSPAILLIEAVPTMEAFLAEYVRGAGYRSLLAHQQCEAQAILTNNPAIVLALCDLEVLPPHVGIETIRMLRSRWPQVPVAAIVGDLRELQELFGTPAWPPLVLPKPVNLGLLDELLRLVTRRTAG